MLAAAIAVTGLAALALIGYAAFWLITDARERKYQAEMADRFLALRAISNNRYLRDDEGRPS